MKRSNSTTSTGDSPYFKRERLIIGQKREVMIPMLKSGKSTSTVALQFGIGETTVQTSSQKMQNWTNTKSPLVPPSRQNRSNLKVLLSGKKSKRSETNFKNPEKNNLKMNSGASFYPGH